MNWTEATRPGGPQAAGARQWPSAGPAGYAESMTIAHDTDAAAHRAQINMLKRLGGSRRAALGLQLADQGRELAVARAIASNHPG